jgi:hypothetical protein
MEDTVVSAASRNRACMASHPHGQASGNFPQRHADARTLLMLEDEQRQAIRRNQPKQQQGARGDCCRTDSRRGCVTGIEHQEGPGGARGGSNLVAGATRNCIILRGSRRQALGVRGRAGAHI